MTVSKKTQTVRSGEEDDIDRLVSDLLKNPDQADAIKSRLRARLDREKVVKIPADMRTSAMTEPDDLWDNVPVSNE